MSTTPSQSHTTIDTFTVVSREDIVRESDSFLSRPDLTITREEHLFAIQSAGLDWDIGVVIYQPEDQGLIPTGADGMKVGIYLLHGGEGDFKSMEHHATLLATKFGYRVVSGTYPGRLYLDDRHRDWPGDTIKLDGTVRTPIWKRGEHITPDQYEVRQDDSMRTRYGRRTVAKAKPGTLFRDRLAASPLAMEAACRTAMQLHFPEDEFSIYLHGHSTGGPLQFMMSQRVSNIEGVLAIENSAFGYINEQKHMWGGPRAEVEGKDSQTVAPKQRDDPFDELSIRTWRDTARYAGAEALKLHGPSALLRLPMLMEDVLDDWESSKRRPQFKCEYLVTWNIVESLAEAALHTAARLNFTDDETTSLVSFYVGMTSELREPNTKPVPNVLFGISANSRDHSPDVYEAVILPMFAAMKPAPLTTVTHYQAGKHYYLSPEDDLPYGIAPAVFSSWDAAINGGYFLRN